MMQALGLIETVGLTAAIEAADVACKTANVKLVGYGFTKGGGYVTVKVLGQVGAVTAAIDAAAVAAGKVTRVVSTLVIPRPADGIEPLVKNATTKGYRPPEQDATAKVPEVRTSRLVPRASATEPTSLEGPSTAASKTSSTTQPTPKKPTRRAVKK